MDRGGQGDSIQRLMGYASAKGIETVDLKFVDLVGRWHHLSLPMDRLDGNLFRTGVAFDGSSVAGYSKGATSDMTLLPDPETGVLDPVWDRPTLSLICDIYTGDGNPYLRDPRGIARRAERYMKEAGIADEARISPEFEFYVFDSVRHRSDVNVCFYEIDSEEGEWNADEPGRGGTRLPLKGGYHALPPQDRLHDFREGLVRLVQAAGIPVKYHHHEGGGAGQVEIEILFHPLLRAGDVAMLVKYLTRMAADRAGKTATFMPKPLWNAAGNGMHFHQHLFRDGVNLFWEERGWGGLSELALYYIGGLLHHAPALLGLTNPSTNSYKRLVPGFEAPVTLIVLADMEGWKPGNRFAEKNFAEMVKAGAMTQEKREWFNNACQALYGASEARGVAFACKNTAFFAMNLMLAAKSKGLDTHPMDGFDLDAVRKEFAIPDHYWLPLLMAVGYFRADKTLNPRAWRKTYDEIVVKF